MKTLLTKKAINELVKAKDTDGIIKIYELEEKQNPFDEYKMRRCFGGLTHIQKEVAKELLQKGFGFGLSNELICELKELFGLVKITRIQRGNEFIKQIYDYNKKTYICEYPF